MKQIILTLTIEKWWDEIKNHPTLSPLAKSKLPGAINSFLTYHVPPISVPYLSPKDFQEIKDEIESITLDGKPLFIVCETHPDFVRIRVTDQKSPGWDETIFAPEKIYNEGTPELALKLKPPKEKHVYLIRTLNSGEHYFNLQYSPGDTFTSTKGVIIQKKRVTGWFKIC